MDSRDRFELETGAEPPDGSGSSLLTRRRALWAGWWLLAGTGIAAPTATAVVRYLSPDAAGRGSAGVELGSDELSIWQARRVVVGGRPGFVLRTPDGLQALSGVCTHLGCVVRWQRSRRQFFCPCHGGRFAPNGRVLGGPPPAPLDSFEVAESEGRILVRSA